MVLDARQAPGHSAEGPGDLPPRSGIGGRDPWPGWRHREAEAATDTPVKVLTGGTLAWRDLGYPLTGGFENMAQEPDDHYPSAYDRDTDVERAMRDYLAWETSLVAQVERDGDARFDIVRPGPA